jgi:hypothetical protein
MGSPAAGDDVEVGIRPTGLLAPLRAQLDDAKHQGDIALIDQVLGQVVDQPTLKERPLPRILQMEIPTFRKIDGPHCHTFPDLISQNAEVANKSTPF